jgi:hypothetical protein
MIKKIIITSSILLASTLLVLSFKPQLKTPDHNDQPNTNTVTQTITTPNEQITNSYSYSPNETPLDLLDRTQTITVKEYDFGTLVESINDLNNGQDEMYWIYYLNDQQATVGASEYQLQNNDHIEWRFQTYEQ